MMVDNDWKVMLQQCLETAKAMEEVAQHDPAFVRSFDRESDGLTYAELHDALVDIAAMYGRRMKP